jgi:ribonuclease P protein component
VPDRVRTRRQFAQFASPTGRASSGPLRISYVAGESSVGVAYAIGRHVGSAVVRNRLRRRLRALVDALEPTPPTGFYLIRVGPEARLLSYEELQDHLRIAVERIRAR